VAQAPDTLTFKTHRDQEGRSANVWIRRALLALLSLLLVLALLDFFGQRPTTSTAATSRARLQVYAPTHARSGVVYAARFRIDAVQELKDATLVLAFGFGHIPAGQHLTFWLSLQVNPTNVGRHLQTVRLYDGKTLLATVPRHVTVFP
jgi:hypothetical protein